MQISMICICKRIVKLEVTDLVNAIATQPDAHRVAGYGRAARARFSLHDVHLTPCLLTQANSQSHPTEIIDTEARKCLDSFFEKEWLFGAI